MVTISFSAFFQYASATLEQSLVCIMCSSSVSRHQAISSYMNSSALVLDSVIPTERYKDLTLFLDGGPLISVVQSALEGDLSNYPCTEAMSDSRVRAVAMHIASQGLCKTFSKSYHTSLWLATLGAERCKPLAEAVHRVFSLLSSSSGVKRSFNVRSCSHDRNCVQLNDENADKQAYLIYNSGSCGVGTKR